MREQAPQTNESAGGEDGSTLEKDHLLRAVYELSHDLGNLLSVIHGRGELTAMRLPENDPGRKHLDHLQEAVKRAFPLVNKLKALGRKTAYNPELINLNDVVEDLIPMVQRIVSVDVTITTHLENTLPRINADIQQLEQSIAHICMMARGYLGDEGNLVIRTGVVSLVNEVLFTDEDPVTGRFVSLSIQDDGRGLNDGEIEQLLNPALARSRPLKVFGMGFDKVRFFLSHHKGHTGLVSTPTVGTTVTLYFPLTDDVIAEL